MAGISRKDIFNQITTTTNDRGEIIASYPIREWGEIVSMKVSTMNPTMKDLRNLINAVHSHLNDGGGA